MEAEQLSLLVNRMKLTEGEIRVMDLADDEIDVTEQSLKTDLLCKILTPKLIHPEIFKTNMPKIWNFVSPTQIICVGKNLFLCIFQNLRDRRQIIEHSPWFFDKAIILMDDPRSTCKFSNNEFKSVSFWIHVHNLPPAGQTKKMAISIGNMLGTFLVVDSDDNGNCWGHSLRIRVKLDSTEPLQRGVKVKVGSMAEEIWCPITYEKLPDFCYFCGRIGHTDKDCSLQPYDATREKQYEPWLRNPSKQKGSLAKNRTNNWGFRGRGRGGVRGGNQSGGFWASSDEASDNEEDRTLISPVINRRTPAGQGQGSTRTANSSDKESGNGGGSRGLSLNAGNEILGKGIASNLPADEVIASVARNLFFPNGKNSELECKDAETISAIQNPALNGVSQKVGSDQVSMKLPNQVSLNLSSIDELNGLDFIIGPSHTIIDGPKIKSSKGIKIKQGRAHTNIGRMGLKLDTNKKNKEPDLGLNKAAIMEVNFLNDSDKMETTHGTLSGQKRSIVQEIVEGKLKRTCMEKVQEEGLKAPTTSAEAVIQPRRQP